MIIIELIHFLETERMQLRLLNINDVNEVMRQFSDSDMCKYFSEDPCDFDEAKAIIDHYEKPEGKDYFRYGMFDKKTGIFIGTCGYHYWDNVLKQVEIGYDIWKAFWKQGYVSEVLPVLINLCFEYLDVNRIYILTHQQNEASIASARKFGFKECKPCRDIYNEEKCMQLFRTEWHNKA